MDNKSFINSDSIVNLNEFQLIESISICPICDGILIDPMKCQSCENCFCFKCISEWQKKSNTCPYHCEKFTIYPSKTLSKLLEKMKFQCPLGCNEVIPYKELDYHSNNKCKTLGLVEKYHMLMEEYDNLKKQNSMMKKSAYKIPDGMKALSFMSEYHQHALVKCKIDVGLVKQCGRCNKTIVGNDYINFCSFCVFIYCAQCEKMELIAKQSHNVKQDL